VKRFSQLRHSRRRRIERPPSHVRESITLRLSLSALQNGQCMENRPTSYLLPPINAKDAEAGIDD
jgi:hypothetical protein